jgi:FkbM family methyltransferase
MIISDYLHRIGYTPRIIIHAGAHMAQEADLYACLGVERVVWIEADPERVQKLRAHLARRDDADRHIVVEALIAETDGAPRPFYCFSNDGESSSLYRGTDSLTAHWPEVKETGEVKQLVTRRLDTVLSEAGLRPEDVDTVVLDLQGAELLALEGAGMFLENVQFIEIEISRDQIYHDAPLHGSIRARLADAGFAPVTEIPWHGDVIFIRIRQPTAPDTAGHFGQAFSTFHSSGYVDHNRARLQHLASLALPMSNKSVLEPGAGIGDHTLFYLRQGCVVTAVEPRPENCAAFRENLGAHRQIRRECWSLVQGDVSAAANLPMQFDVVHCYGILYHLTDPEASLRALTERCADLMIVETCVTFGETSELVMVEEPVDNLSQAINGIGCRPTRQWVLDQLRLLFPFVYVPSTQPDHPEFPVDWLAAADHTALLARAVFIASRRPLQNPLMLDYLPMTQRRICQ